MRAARRRARRDRMGDGRGRLQAAAVAPAPCRGTDRARRGLAAASRVEWPSGRHRLGLRPRRRGELRVRAVARRARRYPDHQGRRPRAQPHPDARRRGGRRAWRFDFASCIARARARHPDGARRARCDAEDSRRYAMRRRWRFRCREVDAMTARPRVFISQPIAPSAVARLRKIADVKMNPDSSKIITKPKMIAGAKRADYLISLLHDKVDRAVLRANPKLRGVVSMSITPDNIDVAEATKRGIPVTVVPPIVAEATSDIHFGLMLMVARHMVEGD